jgi:hypothetical protein
VSSLAAASSADAPSAALSKFAACTLLACDMHFARGSVYPRIKKDWKCTLALSSWPVPSYQATPA